MSDHTRWVDLKQRLVTALLLAISAIIIFGIGGVLWAVFTILLATVMHWELAAMLSPLSAKNKWLSAVISAFGLMLAIVMHGYVLPFLIIIFFASIQYWFLQKDKLRGCLYSFAILLSGMVLYELRTDHSLLITLWLILIVILTDVAGYFVGRVVGGPKFWPRVSPKKTWSGAAGGWFAALVLGYGFAILLVSYGEIDKDQMFIFLVLSFILSFASQMGDIYESALKRKSGVKDSSNLLPGHGGFLDRFDGIIGAALAFGLFSPFLLDL